LSLLRKEFLFLLVAAVRNPLAGFPTRGPKYISNHWQCPRILYTCFALLSSPSLSLSPLEINDLALLYSIASYAKQNEYDIAYHILLGPFWLILA
jgi:hypothetical protein